MAAFAAVKKMMKEHRAQRESSGAMPFPGPGTDKKRRKRLFEKKPLDTSL